MAPCSTRWWQIHWPFYGRQSGTIVCGIPRGFWLWLPQAFLRQDNSLFHVVDKRHRCARLRWSSLRVPGPLQRENLWYRISRKQPASVRECDTQRAYLNKAEKWLL